MSAVRPNNHVPSQSTAIYANVSASILPKLSSRIVQDKQEQDYGKRLSGRLSTLIKINKVLKIDAFSGNYDNVVSDSRDNVNTSRLSYASRAEPEEDCGFSSSSQR